MPDHRAEDHDHIAPSPRRTRGARRVTTPAPEGSDPSPAPEPSRHHVDENDEQLKRDKPPHWG
ncbi:MAG TPA: hypothetical protein PK282_03235 [Rhodoglobus sp.]|jgi:hypothetical protein|nr:hypothetical protein [Rhodoglobus sp.]HPG75686.1 hypothetical protein [Rhodoglobus sp.]HPM51227.1 hypothetical protein [Rhodoglobus sp.]